MPKAILRFARLASVLLVAGCGTTVPRMEEAWEAVTLPDTMEYRVKDHIFCELVKSLWYAREQLSIRRLPSPIREPVIPDSFGVQVQTSLTVEENTNLNPGLNFTRQFRSVVEAGNPVGRNLDIGFGAELSSTATRTDTSYAYYNVGRISGPGKNEHCADPKREADRHGSSLLLQSDLGIEDFLRSVAPSSRLLKSSPSGELNKSAMIDVYSYDIKFAVVTNGSVNPLFKLVNLSANTSGGPLISAGRKRTHQLVLTFGPGEREPSPSSLQTHFNSQIVRSLDSLRQ